MSDSDVGFMHPTCHGDLYLIKNLCWSPPARGASVLAALYCTKIISTNN